MADKFNEQLTRERNAVEQVGVIKNAIKSVAENKSIEVLDTDTPQSVLSKIDKFSGGDYNIESAILEDGTQELRIFDAEKGVKETVGRPEPETWKRIRETLHTNPNDQFFLIGSGASDTFALKFSHGTVGTTISVYGGTDGTTLLFSDTPTTNFWSMYLRDLENYPLPNGLHFSDLQGCPYSDDIIGDCELFAVVVHREDNGISYSYINLPTSEASNRQLYYNVLEYAGNSAVEFLLYMANGYGQCPNCEFVFLGENVTNIGRYAFTNTGIYTINLNEGMTAINSSTFRQCYRLQTITLPSTLNVIHDYAFSETALTEIIIPDTVVYMYERVFKDCKLLKKVRLSSTLTYIGGYAFEGTDSLKTLEIPSGVTILNNHIFYYSGIQDIIFKGDIEKINNYSFYYSQLQNIKIPDSVTYIGDNVFTNNVNLKKLESNCVAVDSCLNTPYASSLRYINLPNAQLKGVWVYGQRVNILRIGSFGEVEGSESPTLGLKTPIFVDYANSPLGSNTTPIHLYYACLTLDHLKSIFDWLPVTTTAKSMKCGNQYTMDLTTGQLTASTAFEDFLAWYNTLPDTDPGDGTIWKKGWSVIA